ncbi:MAG: biopolymer transporter ExbD [Deltaproteobacteria bacterium]|nr:biopolymer transporter ExbD [Deltaproteobacteria bacterium]
MRSTLWDWAVPIGSHMAPVASLFVILAIHLLNGFSPFGEWYCWCGPDIPLPVAMNGEELTRAPVIQISKDAIVLEGEQLALVADLAHDEYWNIPTLEEKLRDLKQRYDIIHQLDPAAKFEGEINIQAHRELRFQTIKRVMYSCGRAGYRRLSLTVESFRDWPPTR